MKKIHTLALAALVSASASAQTAAPSADGRETMKVEIKDGRIDVLGSVVYSQILSVRANRALRMTLLLPKSEKPLPAIVFFPGGGFTSANHDRFIEMRLALAKAGFVVASAEYRTVPDVFPAPVVDAKAAVRYLRAHAAELGIDPAHIGALGDSAGGYVSQMLGTTNGEKEFDQGDNLDQSSDVQAAATIYGISNLLNIGEGFPADIQAVHASPAVTEALLVHGTAFASFPGSSILADRDKALHASPMGHIKEGLPPFLIMHGDSDRLVSPKQSEQLYEALKAKGNAADYVVLEGADHADLCWYQQPVIDKVVRWFKEKLK